MRTTLLQTTVLTLLLAWGAPATAQEVSCADIEFADEIVERYPLVEDACQGVVERDGDRFVVLRARVARMNDESMLIEYLHSDQTWGPYVEVSPPDDLEVRIGGLPTPWRDLQARQEVTVYLPESRWALAMVDVAEPEFVEPTFVPVTHAVSAEPKEAEEPAVEAGATPAAGAEAPADDPAPAAAEPATPAAEPATPSGQQTPVPEDGGSSMLWYLIIGVVAILLVVLLARRRSA